jgi:endonuclease III
MAKKAGKRSPSTRAEPTPAGSRSRAVRLEGIPFDLPSVSAAEKRRALGLLAALDAEYPAAHCELDYTCPHELLIATILSAQTTDANVNKATPALFARSPSPADYARATPQEIEPYVKSLGFFRNKAKAVHLAMKAIVEQHSGQVPRTMDQLLELQGVARKTANVVLGNAFGVNAGFVVDTHIERLSKRFALAPRHASVQTIERRLMALFPRDRWCDLSHMIIWHGRRACKARGVACGRHPICAKFGTACELRVTGKATAEKAGAPGRNSGARARGTSTPGLPPNEI